MWRLTDIEVGSLTLEEELDKVESLELDGRWISTIEIIGVETGSVSCGGDWGIGSTHTAGEKQVRKYWPRRLS